MPDSRRFWFSRKTPGDVKPEASTETPADRPTTMSSETSSATTQSHSPSGEKENAEGNGGVNNGGGGGGDNGTPPPPAGNKGNHAMGLDALVQGLQHAAFSANQYMAHQYIAVLSQLFEQTPDGSYKPDYAELQLDDGHRLNVPLVTLAPPRNLSMERMKMRLTVRGDATEAISSLAGQGERGHFRVTMAPQPHEGKTDTQNIDIEIDFVAQEPPEAVLRLLDEFIHRMTPVPITENNHE
ncbi:hypothetical protein CA284_12150 [Enterobacter mori]|jgi:hypothetical protein|nr:hypothetical protein CA284_12150 [Enterobacter mori]